MPDTDISTYVRDRGIRWAKRLDAVAATVREPRPLVEGRLTRAAGLTLEARGCHAALGTRCLIQNGDDTTVEAEVVGFADERTFLMPTGAMHGVMPRAPVIPTGADSRVGVGDALLGRVIDGAGNALDRGGPVYCEHRAPLQSAPINPLTRAPINEPLDVGVRSMNALFTAGRGQRLGLFAGSGIGKSSLLAMMTRYTRADVIVVGLIGERGREVKEFVEDNLGEDAMSRAVVVATPADSSPLMRVHGAWRATSIAEHFRSQGHDVLLLMDSLTRFAQAQREIGLAIGEPPATKGYPPSVFARLPQLVERAGTGRDGAGVGRGSITAFYTVLAEGDDEQDPIVDAARAILDGHIMLSRATSESGIYPPVDVERSVSRSMPRVAADRHVEAARRFREIYSYYMRHRDLITVGAYRPGGDPQLDHAVALWPAMQKFLAQSLNQAVGLNDSIAELIALVDSRPVLPAKAPEETADTTAKEKMNVAQR